MHLSGRSQNPLQYISLSIGISYRKTTELLHELFALKCVPVLQWASTERPRLWGTIYEDLREKIRISDVVHADEPLA